MDKGDTRGASLFLARALQLTTDNIEVCETAAILYEDLGMIEAIPWWQRVVELTPRSTKRRLALARAALRFRKFDIAEAALSEIVEEEKSGAEYFGLTAAIAASKGRFDEAQRLFLEAQRLEPANEEHRLNALKCRFLKASTAQARSDTLAEVRLFAQASTGLLRLMALRILRDNSAADSEAALDSSRLIMADQNADWTDRFAHLALLLRSSPIEFEGSLRLAEDECERQTLAVAPMIAWMTDHHLGSRVPEWMSRIAPAVAGIPDVLAQRALALASVNEWEGVLALVEAPGYDWGTYDFLRSALRARAFVSPSKIVQGDAQWSKAVTLALRIKGAPEKLARLALSWGWVERRRDLLWRMVAANHPQTPAVLAALFAELEQARDASGLQRVFSEMLSRNIGGSMTETNFAFYSLLLNKNIDRADQVAQTLFKRQPLDARFAATYAYACFVKGRNLEGLAALAPLPAAERNAVAVQYPLGLLQVAAGQGAEGAVTLSAIRGQVLFPEQTAMIDAALRRVARPPDPSSK